MPYRPAAQFEQVVAPAAAYLPAAQDVQLEEPAEEEKVTLEQSAHAEAAAEYLPAGQAVQSVLNLLPETEVVPAGQLAQTVASVKVADEAPARAYLPTGHVIVPVHAFVERPAVDP